MKKITKEITNPSYPFSSNDFPYLCCCKDPVLLRKSQLLGKIFVVSESDPTEIVDQHRHRCTKSNTKRTKKSARH